MRSLTLAFLLLFGIWATGAGGQEDSPSDAPPDPVASLAETIESELDALTPEEGEITEDQTQIRDLYTSALAEVNLAKRNAAAAADFRRLIDEEPSKLDANRERLASDERVTIPPTDEMLLSEIELALAEAQSSLQAKRLSSTQLDEESTHRDQRRSAIPELISTARQRLAELNTQSTTPDNTETPALSRAREVLRQARVLALETQIRMLEAESASYDARTGLLSARKSVAAKEIEDARKRVSLWQDAADRKRQSEAAAAARDSAALESQTARLPEVLQQYAQETTTLANDLEELTLKIEPAAREARATNTKIDELKSQFGDIQRRLNVSGLNRETGFLLRDAYDQLPDEYTIRKRISSVQDELEEVRYQLLEFEDDLEEANTVEIATRDLLRRLPGGQGEDASGALQKQVRALVEDRRDLLEQHVTYRNTLVGNLEMLITALREQKAISGEYRDFVEERIFWVRNIEGDRFIRISDLRDTLSWLSGPERWMDSARGTLQYASQRWFIVGPAILALILLYVLASRARRHLKALSTRVSSYRTDSFAHTAEAALVSTLIVAPTTLLLFLVGLLLTGPEDQIAPVRALGHGFQTAALTYLPLAFLRVVVRPKGLAEAHFRWPAGSLGPIRRNLRWFIPLVVALEIIVTGLNSATSADAPNASVGRIAFTIGLIALALFLQRLLKPKGPVLKRFLEENSGGILYRLRYLWYPLAVLLPILFVILSWAGFYYTALQLESKLEQSLALAMILVVLNAILHRWLFIARRKVAIEDAKRRREQALAEEKAKQSQTADHQPETPPVDEEKVDLPALSLQTRQLFKAASVVSIVLGLYLIWAQALPALRMLDRVQLWPDVRILEAETSVDLPVLSYFREDARPAPASEPTSRNEGDTTSGDDFLSGIPGALGGGTTGESEPAASTAAAQEEDTFSLTLADLGLAIVALIATIVAFRNVPGLIEIMVLQRLPLDTGSRYALSTVLRYIIAIVGIAFAFTVIGITWDKVQWLAAALTFGLAFGLQEIFANFISGLIILAERPVRLGDTVTVGTTTGTVTRIRMRATTITDWDRKEMIIPNKTFITTDVINWSLSDPVIRMIIGVGVSYSSDVDLVEKLLKEVASENHIVLAEPKPQVVFINFGDSTLDYELRVFIPSIEHLIPQRHAIRTAIIKKFREHDVEIAFPQRDLHVRSIGELAKFAPKDGTGEGRATHDAPES